LIRSSKEASYVEEVISKAYRFRHGETREKENEKGRKQRRERERERGGGEASNIRKMLVCGYVRREREGLLDDLQGEEEYAFGCVRVRVWIDGGVGQRPESTKPMLEIMHTPSSRRTAPHRTAPHRTAPRRARKNRNMAVASHALFALLFCTPTIPRTID